MCLPLFWYFKAIPLIAVLLASLAPLVYIISLGLTPKIFAIWLVEASINLLASTPNLCKELGLPM